MTPVVSHPIKSGFEFKFLFFFENFKITHFSDSEQHEQQIYQTFFGTRMHNKILQNTSIKIVSLCTLH